METVFVFLLVLLACGTALDKESFYTYYMKSMDLSREDSNETSKCNEHIGKFLEGLIDGETWTLQMLDASGSVPVGMLRGNRIDMGLFDECVQIRHETDDDIIKGRYCFGGLIVPLTESDNSSDVNDTAFRSDVQAIRPNLVPMNTRDSDDDTDFPTYFVTSICIPDSCYPSDVFGALGSDVACSTEDQNKILDAGDIAFLIFFGLIMILLILSTSYDVYMQKKKLKIRNSILIAFSLYTNGKKIIKVSNAQNQIMCFNGMKVLSLFWVIAGHRYSLQNAIVVNILDTEEWQQKWYSFYIMLAPLAVDTFLFITGALISQSFLKAMSKPDAKFNIFLYYLHRYLRLTPAVAVLWFFQVTIARRIGSGPRWISMHDGLRDTCLDMWWTVFLYIQNYFGEDNMCLLHTWYISMDMQFFILSPFILLPLVKYRKLMATVGLPLIIIVATLYPTVTIYVHDLEYLTTDYYDYYYYVSHTRASPYLIGIAFGSFILNKKKYHINDAINVTMWSAVIAIIAVLFLSQRGVIERHDRLETMFYMGLQRPVWAICLCWISFACIHGYGGFINSLLSWSLFQVISKITYSVYLVHVTLLLFSLGQDRALRVFTDYDTFHTVVGDIVFATVLGAFWTLAFESPMITIEKIIFGGAGGGNAMKKEAQHQNQLNDINNKTNDTRVDLEATTTDSADSRRNI